MGSFRLKMLSDFVKEISELNNLMSRLFHIWFIHNYDYLNHQNKWPPAFLKKVKGVIYYGGSKFGKNPNLNILLYLYFMLLFSPGRQILERLYATFQNVSWSECRKFKISSYFLAYISSKPYCRRKYKFSSCQVSAYLYMLCIMEGHFFWWFRYFRKKIIFYFFSILLFFPQR